VKVLLQKGTKLGNSASAKKSGAQSLSWKHHPGKPTVKLTSAVDGSGGKAAKKGKKVGGPTHYIHHVVPGNLIEANVCCELYYQLPGQDHSTTAQGGLDQPSPYFLDLLFMELLEELLYEPFFDRLRTQQQLGYSVSCSFKNNCGVLGYHFAVTSSLYTASTIESSMLQFVDSIPTSLLPDMADELFSQYVTSFVSKQTKVEANLVAHSNRYIWDCVADRDYAFSMSADCAEYLKSTYALTAPGVTGTKTLQELKAELTKFAYRLFTGSYTGSQNTQNVLIVRSFHEHINAEKKDGFSCDLGGESCQESEVMDDGECVAAGAGKGGIRIKRACLCGERVKAKAGGNVVHCQVCLPSASARRKVKEVRVQEVADFHDRLPVYDNLI
jgi:hypothetical protein